MSKLEKTVNANFDALLDRIVDEITGGSITASLEESVDIAENGTRCSIRAFERYSWTGSNRVSLTVTLLQTTPGVVRVVGVATGGSAGMFFKINTFGEDSFLEKLADLL